MEKSSIIKIVVLVSLSTAYAAIEGINIANIANVTGDDVKNVLHEQGITLPPEFEDANLPSVEDGLKLIKDKCAKESGSSAAFEQASDALLKLQECAESIVNITALPEEIEQNKPHGNLDQVFKKYCDKRSKAIKCVEEFTDSLDPCLTEAERDQKVVFVNISKSLMEFVCHGDGDQIALFIAEEGPQCFSDKSEHIQECATKTFEKYSNETLPDADNLPSLIIKEENCIDMDKLEHCVVTHLEKCAESTPANLVEALFRFIRKETPCKSYKKWQPPTKTNNSNPVSKFSLNVLLGTWLMAIVAKLFISLQ